MHSVGFGIRATTIRDGFIYAKSCVAHTTYIYVIYIFTLSYRFATLYTPYHNVSSKFCNNLMCVYCSDLHSVYVVIFVCVSVHIILVRNIRYYTIIRYISYSDCGPVVVGRSNLREDDEETPLHVIISSTDHFEQLRDDHTIFIRQRNRFPHTQRPFRGGEYFCCFYSNLS